MTNDAIPNVVGPPGLDLARYSEEILERFGNSAVRDQLIRIATDGASKIPVFHAQTIADLFEKDADISREVFLFACYAQYLTGRDDDGNDIGLNEPLLSADEIAQLVQTPAKVLTLSAFAPLGLAQNRRFVAEFESRLAMIQRDGTAAALRDLLGHP